MTHGHCKSDSLDHVSQECIEKNRTQLLPLPPFLFQGHLLTFSRLGSHLFTVQTLFIIVSTNSVHRVSCLTNDSSKAEYPPFCILLLKIDKNICLWDDNKIFHICKISIPKLQYRIIQCQDNYSLGTNQHRHAAQVKYLHFHTLPWFQCRWQISMPWAVVSKAIGDNDPWFPTNALKALDPWRELWEDTGHLYQKHRNSLHRFCL